MNAAPHPTAAAGHLHAALQQLRTLVFDPSCRRPTLAELVLEHGRVRPRALARRGAPAAGQGDCFAAAHEWARREGWTYCGGYALVDDPLIGAFETGPNTAVLRGGLPPSALTAGLPLAARPARTARARCPASGTGQRLAPPRPSIRAPAPSTTARSYDVPRLSGRARPDAVRRVPAPRP
ncbi:hypothetical protein [Streptomyces sp. NBC_00151]|uniref:hypothetical protein n=1 Tax=Streptomyces sp. NBC_00151 TaxID=2975669 RepID=UPI002DD7E174|nr:hypothetical protein [Streptomyces sp. NBC_00151]WRZ44600.1 hypothetical protein OG915_45385 [Streptomyces sp. NBC_00151]